MTAKIIASVPVVTDVSSERIADMIVGAVEGGSTYWCSGLYLESPGDVAPDDDFKGEIWYANPHRYEDPDLKIRVVEIEDESSGETKDHIIGQDEIKKGLALMAEKSPTHFADLISGNDDAITADVFLQYVTLGEVVYG